MSVVCPTAGGSVFRLVFIVVMKVSGRSLEGQEGLWKFSGRSVEGLWKVSVKNLGFSSSRDLPETFLQRPSNHKMDRGLDGSPVDIFFEVPHTVPSPTIDVFNGCDSESSTGPKELTVPLIQVAKHGDHKGGFQEFELLSTVNPKTYAALACGVCGLVVREAMRMTNESGPMPSCGHSISRRKRLDLNLRLYMPHSWVSAICDYCACGSTRKRCCQDTAV